MKVENLIEIKTRQLEKLVGNDRDFNEYWYYANTDKHEILHIKGFRSVESTPHEILAIWRGMHFHIPRFKEDGYRTATVRNHAQIIPTRSIYNFVELESPE